jgi:hypothetical protein
MINKPLKMRLKKDRPSTTITMRIPADIVDSLRALARCAALRLIKRF